MNINGIEIPEWMAKNNSEEKLKSIIDNQSQSREDLNNSVSDDYNPDDTYGVIVLLKTKPIIMSMGQSEDEAISMGMQLELQDPTKAVFIFSAEHLSNFID
jgi:hypothetical protein